MLFGITVTLSPIMIWLTQSASGGVMPAVLFHAATNHYTSVFNQSGDKALFNPELEGSFDEIKLAIYLVVLPCRCTRRHRRDTRTTRAPRLHQSNPASMISPHRSSRFPAADRGGRSGRPPA